MVLHTLARACLLPAAAGVSHVALGSWAGHEPGVSPNSLVSPPRHGKVRASLHSTKASGPTGFVWVPGTSLYPSLGHGENPAGKGRAGLTPRWGALGTLLGPSDGSCRASGGLAETFPGRGCKRVLDRLLFGRESFCC